MKLLVGISSVYQRKKQIGYSLLFGGRNYLHWDSVDLSVVALVETYMWRSLLAKIKKEEGENGTA